MRQVIPLSTLPVVFGVEIVSVFYTNLCSVLCSSTCTPLSACLTYTHTHTHTHMHTRTHAHTRTGSALLGRGVTKMKEVVRVIRRNLLSIEEYVPWEMVEDSWKSHRSAAYLCVCVCACVCACVCVCVCV